MEQQLDVDMFSGEKGGTILLDDWIFQVELKQQINNWSVKRAFLMAGSRLKGPALDVFQDILEKGDNLTLENLFHALKHRFTKKVTKVGWLKQIMDLKQVADESVHAYILRVEKLKRKAESEMGVVNGITDMWPNRFINGLSGEVGKLVALDKPKTLDLAFSLAKEKCRILRSRGENVPQLEISNIEGKNFPSVSKKSLDQTRTQNNVSDQLNGLSGQLKKLNNTINKMGRVAQFGTSNVFTDGPKRAYEGSRNENFKGSGNFNNQISGVTCYKCGKVGHFANKCPTIVCRRCGKMGHMANSCSQPRACYSCGSLDHISSQCSKNTRFQQGPDRYQNSNNFPRWDNAKKFNNVGGFQNKGNNNNFKAGGPRVDKNGFKSGDIRNQNMGGQQNNSSHSTVPNNKEWEPKGNKNLGDFKVEMDEKSVNNIYYIDRPLCEITYLKLEVGGEMQTILCDTGSAVSLVKLGVANKLLSMGCAVKSTDTTPLYDLKGAGGANIRTHGVITINIKINQDISVSHNYVIVETMKYDFIWGTDILRDSLRAVIDLKIIGYTHTVEISRLIS